MLNEKKLSKKPMTILIIILLIICAIGISVSAAHKETSIVETLTLNPIDEEQNPLDYVEHERPKTQEKLIGASDEIGVPQYSIKEKLIEEQQAD